MIIRPSQIRRIYSETKPTMPRPIHHWKMDQPQGLIYWNTLNRIEAASYYASAQTWLPATLGPSLYVDNTENELNWKTCKFGGDSAFAPFSDADAYRCIHGLETKSFLHNKRGCMEFWWRPDYNDVGYFNQYRTFIGSWGGITHPPEPDLQTGDGNITFVSDRFDTNRNTYALYVGKTGETTQQIGTGYLPAYQWYKDDVMHLAVSWDLAGLPELNGNTHSIFRDGSLIFQGTPTNIATAAVVPYLVFMAWGGTSYHSDVTRYMGYPGCDGTMENFKVWNYAKLDFSDRTEMDTSSSLFVRPYDSIGDEHGLNSGDRMILNKTGVAGPGGKCYEFDGVVDYLHFDNLKIPHPTGAVSVWVWINDYDTAFDLVSWGPGSGNDFRMILYNTATALMGWTVGSADYRVNISTKPALKEWTLITLTWGSFGTRLYYNTSQVGSYATPSPAVAWTAGTDVGRYGATTSGYFTGKMKDLKIFDRSLLSSNVIDIYRGTERYSS